MWTIHLTCTCMSVSDMSLMPLWTLCCSWSLFSLRQRLNVIYWRDWQWQFHFTKNNEELRRAVTCNRKHTTGVFNRLKGVIYFCTRFLHFPYLFSHAQILQGQSLSFIVPVAFSSLGTVKVTVTAIGFFNGVSDSVEKGIVVKVCSFVELTTCVSIIYLVKFWCSFDECHTLPCKTGQYFMYMYV